MTRDGIGEGRLARTVWPHDGVYLTGFDCQIHPFEDLLGAGFGLDIDLQVGDDKVCHVLQCSWLIVG